MTTRGAAPPVVEDGTEPNPPPAWRPGDPDPRRAATLPPPPAPPAAPPSTPAALETPAAERSEADRQPAGASGPESMRTFLDRLVRGRGAGSSDRPPDADDEEDDAAPPTPTAEAGQPEAGAPGTAPSGDAPPPLTGRAAALEARLRKLSPAERDTLLARGDSAFARAVQEEIDRRAFTAQRQQADQGRMGRQQQLQQLAQREQELRRTDVYEAARVRDQIDAMQQQDGFLENWVKAYDQVALDPLMLALPEAERKPILEAMPPGMDGRKFVTEQAIQRIQANAQAEAERRLRRSPAFRKQVLAELRGETAPDGEDDEPELGADRRSAPRPRNNGKSSMDALIRRGFGQQV